MTFGRVPEKKKWNHEKVQTLVFVTDTQFRPLSTLQAQFIPFELPCGGNTLEQIIMSTSLQLPRGLATSYTRHLTLHLNCGVEGPKGTSTLDFLNPWFWMWSPQERQHVYPLAAAISTHLHQADGGPAPCILHSLSSLITLVRYHISLLECRDKKVWEHAATVTVVIGNTGLNLLQVALVPGTHPCRLSSFIGTI